ncbi:hypothetical protein [Polaromonas sp. 17-63-33]|jgi:thioesterase domain-containing protein|uniref:hypothetical protein n=1 Tax=Polaromonas sp. 17-63-33 TaxID=1970413 RepID=UPI000BC61422|nr:hypothetical protein [Polaromonas sp. 17-63-33]OZA45447.1 MAG: hypothetical protein B7X88_24610 [Polaromonas sp. 17-63-33]
MAIGWMTLLKAIPWVEVAKKAPEVAESAKKLWNTIAKNTSQPEVEVEQETTLFNSQDEELKWLKDRLTANEAAYADLHKQMLASAELIKTLADQHTQLVQAVELSRKRLVRLTFIIIIVAIISVYFMITKL